MKPSVCMAIAHFYPKIGGAEIQAQRLAKSLRTKGVDVFVLTQHFRNLKRKEVIDGVPVYRLFTFDRGKLRSLVFMLSTFLFLFRKRREYQIIHTHLASSPAIIATVIAKLFRKRTLVKLGASREFGDIATSKKTFLGRFKLSFLRRYVDIFVAPSQEVKAELLNNHFSLERIRVIPNGVDTDKFFPPLQKRKKNIKEELNLPYEKIAIFTGRLTRQKGIEVLIKAWGKTISTFPQLHLLIVGEGEERESLEQKAKRFNNIHFLGKREDIVNLLQASDVFVLPSLAEGLSNALLEAMACGLPVVATNIGGTNEAIKNGINGILAEPKNPEQLAQVILSLMKNQQYASQLGINARKTIEERYSLDKVSKEYIQLYSQLLKEK